MNSVRNISVRNISLLEVQFLYNEIPCVESIYTYKLVKKTTTTFWFIKFDNHF